jgi:hypothetical protein
MRHTFARWLYKNGWFRLARFIWPAVMIWPVVAAGFTVNTATEYGRITARRVREDT